jgi:hypothetical protein
VSVVTFNAGIESGNVLVATNILFTVELVGAHGFATEERRAGGKVMDVSETKAFCDLIIGAIADAPVNADCRFPALVALQAQIRFRAVFFIDLG